MAYKFKKWRIRWQPDTKKFKKIKRNRKKSRDSYVKWKKNRGKMLAALRKSKPKRKLAMKKNKARGMYKKLSIARSRWKNILKSDINLDNMLDGRLYLDEGVLIEEAPVIDIEHSDLSDIISILNGIKNSYEWESEEDEEVAKDFISTAIENLKDMKDVEELFDDDEEFLEELIAFIEEYGEEIGAIEDDEESDEE